MSDQAQQARGSRQSDRAAAIGCFGLGLLLVLGSAAILFDALTSCQDERHGCAYDLLGAPAVAALGLLCFGAAYVLRPRSRSSGSDAISTDGIPVAPHTLSYRVCTLRLGAVKGWKRAADRLLGFVLPENDPDFSSRREPAEYWWIELDGQIVKREIGFGSDGKILRYAPAGRNWGLFVGEKVSSTDLSGVLASSAFDEAWSSAVESVPLSR